MFPKSSLIVCDSPEEATYLLHFLEDHGIKWGRPREAMYYESCDCYAYEPDKQLCYYFKNDSVDGYCYADWFREEVKYQNAEDPSWDFISVSEFISRVDIQEDEISMEGLL